MNGISRKEAAPARSSRYISIARALLAACAFAALAAAHAQTRASLGAYNVKIDETSVSGISSGAYMAVQFAVAHSALVKGVGAIAGGPYYCGQDNLDTAYRQCMVGYPAYPSASPLVSTARKWAASGDIDSVANIAHQKIWLFHGYNDGVVKQGVTDVLYGFYTSFTDPGNVYYKDNLPAAHAQVTDSWGQACSKTGGDFVNNCGYDAAGQLLQHIYGTLNPRKTGTLSATPQPFDQSPFFSGDIASIGMAQTGYVYVPASCAAEEPCRVHVAFHGCEQYEGAIHSDYYVHAGYNEWADTNHLIVLYPQTLATTALPQNPKGCWDWWGYTDANYAKKSGAQISVVMAMVKRLAGQFSGSSGTSAGAGAFGPPSGVIAADSSASRIELHWTPVAGASGYSVYRAACAGCTFAKVNGTPIAGESFADSRLAPNTHYYYAVRAVGPGGSESADSASVNLTTAPTPPACDPYYRTNYDHWYESRAHLDIANINIYANGSNTWLGYTGPASTIDETALRKMKANYYTTGACP
jgi:poly(3-hydroxybutyrate) depolymerase